MLGMPDEIRDYNPEDSGIWTCLIATTVMYLIKGQPNFPLQQRTLRITATKDSVTRKGREAIIRSIEHGMIKEPHGAPFRFLRIERSNKKETQSQQENAKEKG